MHILDALTEVATRSVVAENRHIRAVASKAANTPVMRQIRDAWERAMDAAIALQKAIREAEDLESASGNPAEGAGSPDAAGEVGSGGVITRRVKESEASTK